jgi:hypothetical protein
MREGNNCIWLSIGSGKIISYISFPMMTCSRSGKATRLLSMNMDG